MRKIISISCPLQDVFSSEISAFVETSQTMAFMVYEYRPYKGLVNELI